MIHSVARRGAVVVGAALTAALLGLALAAPASAAPFPPPAPHQPGSAQSLTSVPVEGGFLHDPTAFSRAIVVANFSDQNLVISALKPHRIRHR